MLTADAVERNLWLLMLGIKMWGVAPAPYKGQRPLTLGYDNVCIIPRKKVEKLARRGSLLTAWKGYALLRSITVCQARTPKPFR